MGQDEYGDKLQSCASDDGVLVHYQRTADVPTGTCAVLVNGGERSLVANLGAANSFTAAHLEVKRRKRLLIDPNYLSLDSFSLCLSML